MTKTIRRLNHKCYRVTGFTVGQLALIVGVGLFIMLWLTGSLPNNHDEALARIYNF